MKKILSLLLAVLFLFPAVACKKQGGADAPEVSLEEIENMEKGGPIAMADLFLFNDGFENEFREATRKLIARAESGEL